MRAFPGRVLYAVKANAEAAIVSSIGRGGVRHFDCASLPGKVALRVDICAGDHLEFGYIGAYSLTGRTDFNGHYRDDIVQISNGSPPE